jgi:hypothetical protein
LGIVSLSTSNQGQLLTEEVAEYANEMTAKNMAHTAVQIAMQKINKDPNWAENHNSPTEKWINVTGDDTTKFHLEFLNDVTGNGFWQADSLRMISEAIVDGKFEATITSLYLKNPFSSLVPGFKGALTIATEYSNISAGGSASISGQAPNGTNCANMPAMTVMNETDSTNFVSATSSIDTEGSPLVDVDTTLSYQPTDELIARLKNSPDAETITGNYKGDMGTISDPGVFFVDGYTKLTGGIKDGYGILIISNDGNMEYEDEDGNELSIAGNFTFHGLVIFENAYNFKGRGTPTINGSVLIGNTEDYDGPPLNIDISGNIHIQYDCRGETYAQMAAAQSVDQYKYTQVVTLEEVGFSTE